MVPRITLILGEQGPDAQHCLRQIVSQNELEIVAAFHHGTELEDATRRSLKQAGASVRKFQRGEAQQALGGVQAVWVLHEGDQPLLPSDWSPPVPQMVSERPGQCVDVEELSWTDHPFRARVELGLPTDAKLLLITDPAESLPLGLLNQLCRSVSLSRNWELILSFCGRPSTETREILERRVPGRFHLYSWPRPPAEAWASAAVSFSLSADWRASLRQLEALAIAHPLVVGQQLAAYSGNAVPLRGRRADDITVAVHRSEGAPRASRHLYAERITNGYAPRTVARRIAEQFNDLIHDLVPGELASI